MLHVHLFNKLLHTTTTRDKRRILLKYIKNYPNWLDRADREILVLKCSVIAKIISGRLLSAGI